MQFKRYDDKEYLVEALKTKSYLEIAKENSVSKTTIQRKLLMFGLTKKRKSWKKEELDILRKNYSSKPDIHNFFPYRSNIAVYRKAFKLKLERPLRRRYHKVNESFFKKWTKESGYLLGWLYSDGNVTADKRTFRFHLSKKDCEILEKFKKLLKSDHPISVNGRYATYCVHSKVMCQDLIARGCGPNKTLKITFPKRIPKKFISHFVRGYFDGDGSLGFNYPNVIKVRIVGYVKFLTHLKRAINKIGKLKTTSVKKCPGNVWKIDIYGDNARKFCEWIYKGCGDLYLNRKRQLYEKHKERREADARI